MLSVRSLSSQENLRWYGLCMSGDKFGDFSFLPRGKEEVHMGFVDRWGTRVVCSIRGIEGFYPPGDAQHCPLTSSPPRRSS